MLHTECGVLRRLVDMVGPRRGEVPADLGCTITTYGKKGESGSSATMIKFPSWVECCLPTLRWCRPDFLIFDHFISLLVSSFFNPLFYFFLFFLFFFSNDQLSAVLNCSITNIPALYQAQLDAATMLSALPNRLLAVCETISSWDGSERRDLGKWMYSTRTVSTFTPQIIG